MKSLFVKSDYPYIPLPMYRSDVTTLQNEYWRLFNRYQQGHYTVSNDHPLHQLLLSIDNIDRDSYDYVRVGLSRASVFMDNSGIYTTELDGPELFPGTYSHYDNIEGVLVNLSAPSIQDRSIPIDELTPLRVLYHPYTTIDLPVMDGLLPTAGLDNNLVVLSLDVGLLLWQYYLYKESLMDTDVPINVKSFIYTYVLYPAAISYANITLFNRATREWLGIPKDPLELYDHPLTLSTSRPGLDRYLSQKVLVQRRIRTYKDILRTIPSTTESPVIDTLAVFTDIDTPHNMGLSYLARFFIVEALVHIGGRTMARKESTLLRAWVRETRRLSKGRYLNKIIPSGHPLFKRVEDLTLLIKNIS